MNSQVVFNMADSDCDFDHCLQKVLDILAERGFNRSLREEQRLQEFSSRGVLTVTFSDGLTSRTFM